MPPMVRNEFETVRQLFRDHVVPTYARFDLAFVRGRGSELWDVTGRRVLDFGGGIAVCCLGHAHPEVAAAIADQAASLVHVSNLYYHEPQGRLAQALVRLIGPGKVFFCNSGAEANEGLFKLARKFGHEEGRFEILTMTNSFHGRTLAGIAATGQDKVKQGFEPMTPGFRHVPYNDLAAVQAAVSPATVAVMIEGVQGEGGITPATPEFLLGLRRLCDEHGLLLLFDAVQCGHFRTGEFQSYRRILEGHPEGAGFLPDAISMAKSLGGGVPIGAFWVRQEHANRLGAGTHGTTYGGTPLACAAALQILRVIERDGLARNARLMGDFLRQQLLEIQRRHPGLITAIRGLGLMLGIEFAPKDRIPALASVEKPVSLAMVERLHTAGLLTIPAGTQVIRLLPALNITRTEAEEALGLIAREVERLAHGG